jgi:Lactate racemase N-terminal domain
MIGGRLHALASVAPQAFLNRDRVALMNLPPIAKVRRNFVQPEVADVPREVARAICSSHLAGRVLKGGRIAITVGSRGIAGLPRIVRAVADTVRNLGFQPFVVAAMGSHGGGTAEGQRQLLAELGVTETTAGCPIRCEMGTVVLGTNSFGLPIHFDENAFDADGIILLNRIKPHTSFTGRYESGLLKMLAIGLGKRQGAAQVHKLGLPGLKTLLPEVGAFLLSRTPVALGLGILENAFEQTAAIVAVEPEELLEVEPRLLDLARELMGRLPFDQIDALIVGELGKNYSGTGLDPNVIGRQRVETMPDLPRPVITRLAVLDLSVETRGNALGIGLADLTTDRLVAQIDPVPMRVNSLTSNFLTRARVPLSLPTDRDVIAACLDTCWQVDSDKARLVIIPNTLELCTLWVTRALAAEVEAHPELTRETDFLPTPIDAAGNLNQERLFPESVRARRKTGVQEGHAPAPSVVHVSVGADRASERIEYKL